MNTAIVYTLTSLTLAIILMIARGKEDGQLRNEFRYQPLLLKVLFICSFIPTAAVAFIYVIAKSKPSGFGLVFFVGGGLLCTALFLYGYRYLKSFVVSVREGSFVVKSIRGEKLIPFSSVRKAIYLNPVGHGGILCLYDDHNRKLIEFSESICGIEDLARLVELNSKKYGILFETRERRV